MKKTIKRAVSLLTVMVLLIGSLPVSIIAKNDETANGLANTGEVSEKKTMEKVTPSVDSNVIIDTDAGTATGIAAHSTVADVAAQFDGAENIKIVDKNGSSLAADALVGTGCKVQLVENGEVKDEITVLIKGEIDGNGIIDSDDAIYILRNTLFASLYPVVVEDDVDGNGKYDSDDAIHLLRYTLFPSMYPLISHTHSWKEANYQEAAKCTICGTTTGTKLIPDFEANNVKCTAQLNKTINFTTRCYDDVSFTSTGTVTFSDYSTFDSTYKHTARDGYVWQSVTMTYVFDDDNANNFGVRTPITYWDYYNERTRKYDENKNEQGYGVFYVDYYGKEYECWWDASFVKNEWEYDGGRKGTYTLSIRIAFSVPVGYDGVVVGTYDANNMDEDDRNILDDYNENCVLYRLPEAKKPIKSDKDTTETLWSLTDGGDHIIAINGTKVVKVPIDTSHLPQNYEDERYKQTVTVTRTLRSLGDWILYKEDYIGGKLDKVTGNCPGFSGSTGWWIINIDGTSQQKFDLDVGHGGIAGYKDGYLYYVLLNGILLFGQKEYGWLCRAKIMEDGSISSSNFVVEIVAADNESYKEAWIEDDWVYYSWYSRVSDDIYSYRVKLDGSIHERN